MHRPSNSSSTLALTALIMAAGASAHAQFNFLADQPLNASETSRRNRRSEEGYYSAQRPAQFDNSPRPAATYSREGVRYSEPAGYAPAQPAQPAWPQAQPVAPQYQPTVPQPGAVTSYPIGADPSVGYAAPAPRAVAPVTSGQRPMLQDAFTGQRPARTEFAAPQPAAQPQWPTAQPVAPQYAPASYANQNWPEASARSIGSQITPPTSTAVVPPTGNPRPLAPHVVSEGVRYAPGAVPPGQAVPEGYPLPDARYEPPTRSGSLDRPGFFSRLLGLGRDRDAQREEVPTQRWSPPPQNYAPAQPQYQPQPEYNFRPAPAAAPAFTPAPAFAPAQDPFSGQRPSRRANEPVPEAPPTRAWPAPRSAVDSPPGDALIAPPAHVSPAEARAFSPLDA